MPSSLAGTLGLITNELITNSVKYTSGNIAVRLEKSGPATYSLSVLDDGPGLPAGYEAARSKGLGMKLVLSLVKQIGGDLQIIPRGDGHRACFTVAFASIQNPTNDETNVRSTANASENDLSQADLNWTRHGMFASRTARRH
jgi:two-component sensor histidine kinase